MKWRRFLSFISALVPLFVFVPHLRAQGYDLTVPEVLMRDGKPLAVDVHTPTGDEGPWPVILIQTPYGRTQYRPGFLVRDPRNPLLASRRYAFAIADWRGFFGSRDSAYSGSPTRGEDGYDLVEWAAEQQWSTGAVGTWGASALGVAQLNTALEHPPSLRACVPMVCHLGDTYEFWYRGGVYFKNRNDFVSEYYGFGTLYRDRPYRNAFWTIIESQMPDFTGVRVPMLFQSGWYDIQTAFTVEVFERLRAAQSAEGLDHSAMLIGPWGHSHMGEVQQGELSYPDAEFADLQAALEFFDHHLLGLDTPTFTGYRTYTLNANRWSTSPAWPPPAASARHYHLAPGGGLTAAPPATQDTMTLTSDPANPVPTLFGTILQDSATGAQGPGDLASLIGRPDTLLFQTTPLGSGLHVEGEPVATVRLRADAPDVDFFARLVQITPEGEALYLADGARRASLRASFETPAFLEPGVDVEVTARLTPIAVQIPAGHRIGLLITCTNTDLFEINPQDGKSYLDSPGATPRIANVEFLVGASTGSVLELPIISQVDGWLLF